MLYGERNPGDAALTLRKYVDLLWIPVLLGVFRDAHVREKAVLALAISIAAVLFLSYLVMADLIPEVRENFAYTLSATVFRTRQTHGALMALGAFLYVQLAVAASSPRMRVLWLTLAVLALINGTLVVQGATGYLIFGALALYLGFTRMGWRGMIGAAAIAGTLGVALALMPGQFQARVATIVNEIRQWQPGVMDLSSSIGTRLELYRVTTEVIRDRPLLGHGTGSFAKAFAVKARDQGPAQQRNPHSEYLHMLVQLGLVGLAGLLFLFAMHWRHAPGLASPLEHHLAHGLLLTMAVGCLFNSWLMDHTEGLLFAWLTGVLFAGHRPR
jgi:O-antigen ligase